MIRQLELLLIIIGFLHQCCFAQKTIVDIVDTAIASGNFKTLVTALIDADLVSTLKSPGPFTVFAPTDAAFAKLPPKTVSYLLRPENKALLTKILTYHVVPGNLTAAAIRALNPPVNVKTVEGQTFLVTQLGSLLKVNDANVIITDVIATNGIIHGLDSVLLPPENLTDIVATAIANGNFNTLVTALLATDLVSVLKTSGPFTVFAPTDAAFAQLPAGALQIFLRPENKGLLASILTYHVVSGNLTAEAIIALNPPINVKTLEGNTFLVTLLGGQLRVNNANVIIPNVFTTNGVIHAIDNVLLPPDSAKDLVETAIGNGNFKTLVTALIAADLVPVLKGQELFTVFAPTDAAFAKLPPGSIANLLRPENKALLTKILTYHVVPGNLTAAAIRALNPPVNVKTVEGQTFLVTQLGFQLKVNDANVITTDVIATNGIIHVIDSVLLPPENLTDIVETAVANGNFNTLVTTLFAADLVSTLQSSGPFTVFAPTDAAFAKLPAGTLMNLLRPENKKLLQEILTYHVVSGNLTAEAILALNPPVKVETLEGDSFLVTSLQNQLRVNDANVIMPNVFATNGIIHVIDTVLFPKKTPSFV